MSRLAVEGSCCLHPACPRYQQVGAGNIIRYGKSRQGQQRYQCTECHHTFNAHARTIFYRCRTPEKDIIEGLARLAEGVSSVRLQSLWDTEGGKVRRYFPHLRSRKGAKVR